jgi:hypothetical protein
VGKMSEFHLPFGLCEVTYDNTKLGIFADKAEFNAVPSYEKLFGGAGKSKTFYILKNYQVLLNLALQEETYENMKLAFPALQTDEYGMYDNPAKVDTTGKTLTIHPIESGDNLEYDITIFSAYIDPEKPYKRVYDKEKDSLIVRFKANPAKQFTGETFKSYFYIGDAVKAGVISA